MTLASMSDTGRVPPRELSMASTGLAHSDESRWTSCVPWRRTSELGLREGVGRWKRPSMDSFIFSVTGPKTIALVTVEA